MHIVNVLDFNYDMLMNIQIEEEIIKLRIKELNSLLQNVSLAGLDLDIPFTNKRNPYEVTLNCYLGDIEWNGDIAGSRSWTVDGNPVVSNGVSHLPGFKENIYNAQYPGYISLSFAKNCSLYTNKSFQCSMGEYTANLPLATSDLSGKLSQNYTCIFCDLLPISWATFCRKSAFCNCYFSLNRIGYTLDYDISPPLN